jgi:hypothetical protein
VLEQPIFPAVSCHVDATTAFPGPRTNRLNPSLGSLGEKHTRPNTLLLVVEGREGVLVAGSCHLLISPLKDFDYVINGYCKNRIGDSFIERGDYQVVRAEDTRVINPSEFAAKVKSGMKVEISIVLRRNADFKDAKTRCPRCRYMNFNVASISDWIEW